MNMILIELWQMENNKENNKYQFFFKGRGTKEAEVVPGPYRR